MASNGENFNGAFADFIRNFFQFMPLTPTAQPSSWNVFTAQRSPYVIPDTQNQTHNHKNTRAQEPIYHVFQQSVNNSSMGSTVVI